MRISIFDRSNQLYPYKLHQKALQDKTKSHKTLGLENQNSDMKPKVKSYFVNKLSFYSKEYGGTFHFLQFNVLHYLEFLNSPEFKIFLKFVSRTYPELK